ncbi:MAG: hypothetical protein EOM26_07125 [Alphaproteobacteria bacterium]|nr:hypothetical protein [Alphaproteobacteria bacterium]
MIISEITVSLPAPREFFQLLGHLTGACEQNHPGLLPVTRFQPNDSGLEITARVKNSHGEARHSMHLPAEESPDIPAVPLDHFLPLIQPHISGLDHTGIVTYDSVREQNQEFLNAVSQSSACFLDAMDEEWLFVVPATCDEILSDRYEDFSFPRQPKFEIVLTACRPVFTFLQIDVSTTLSRDELRRLFPAPVGMEYEGVGQYFRSVRVSLLPGSPPVRFDLRYRNDTEPDDWTSGKMLVRNGKRFRC